MVFLLDWFFGRSDYDSVEEGLDDEGDSISCSSASLYTAHSNILYAESASSPTNNTTNNEIDSPGRMRPKLQVKSQNGGLIVEPRSSTVLSEESEVTTPTRTRADHAHTAESDPEWFTKIYRLTNEYIPKYQRLLDLSVDQNPLYNYLRGPTALDSEIQNQQTAPLPEMSLIRQLSIRRECLLGDVTIRASVYTVISSSAPKQDQYFNAPSIVRELDSCAGFVQYRIENEVPQSHNRLALLWFDLQTLPYRIQLFFKTPRSENHIASFPGGLVNYQRYKKFTTAKLKVQRQLFADDPYISLKHIVVASDFEEDDIAQDLIQYGRDMSDTMNIPILSTPTSLKQLRLFEALGFTLVHELRLGNQSMNPTNFISSEKSEYGSLSSSASTAMLDKSSCSVYFMVRKPNVKLFHLQSPSYVSS
ncbi:uncharacterized protein V1516DRAFT_677905 [Lipomyces oligophaga]|uniref:uncharacterized protein n=1 Tax=Lipomyces oligophaga TaxID=45792 RepID=UPI0034CED054